jgi:hypothetical protein
LIAAPAFIMNHNAITTLMAEDPIPFDFARQLVRMFIKIPHRG